jgi:hypothetical protein
MPFDNLPQPHTPPEIRILQNATRAIRVPELWCQRSFTCERPRKDGGVVIQRCAISALLHAADCIPHGHRYLPYVYEALVAEINLPTRAHVALRLLGVLRSRVRTNRHTIIKFNDRRWTRHADVLALFQRGIERLESTRRPVDAIHGAMAQHSLVGHQLHFQ